MINLLQRVSSASVEIGAKKVAEIEHGLLVLVGFSATDVSINQADETKLLNRMATRLLGYRVFPDAQDRMNLNVAQAEGGVLLVPQFTLAANTQSGLRPGFQSAAPPELAEKLFTSYVAAVTERHDNVQQGCFGADMQVSLVNNGPVTFWQRLLGERA